MMDIRSRVPMIRSLDTFHPKSCPLSLSVELREKDGMPMVEICDLSKNEFNQAWPYESLHVASVPLPDIADLYSENIKGLRLDELNDALPEGYAPYLKKKDVERIREWVIDMRDKYADAILHCAAASHNKETLLKAANERCEEAWESIRETVESGGYNPYDIEDLARRGVAFADLAWALQLPEGQPGSLDVAEVMEAIGKNADDLLDHGLADVVVWNLAQHGQMQTEAFIDYLRSGELSADVDESIAGNTSFANLASLKNSIEEGIDAINKAGNPTGDGGTGPADVPALCREPDAYLEPEDAQAVGSPQDGPGGVSYSLDNLVTAAKEASGRFDDKDKTLVDHRPCDHDR